jgi:hypothetical protein
MQTLQIARRVAVYQADSERCSDWLPALEIRRLLDAGVVKVRDSAVCGVIAVERVAGAKVEVDARPGSFGVRREHLPTGNRYGLSGGVVFSPKRTWEEELAA